MGDIMVDSTANTSLQTLSADRPLANPEDDRLGYAPFAARLAQSITAMTPPQGLTVAIYGSWGSGKTTLLNFMIHCLEQEPEAKRPIIVRFNPWFFSGHEDLTRRFFEQMQAVFRSRLSAIGKEVPKLLADWANLVSEVPVPYAKTGKVLARLLGPRQKDVPARMASSRSNSSRRIAVLSGSGSSNGT